MKNIANLQRQFSSHLFDESDEMILRHLPYSREEALERMDVYRNNVLGNFNGVLESIFPVLKKRIGEKNFVNLCEKYHQKFPSKSGNLDDYGADFPQLLSGQDKDLAKLELAIHNAHFSADVADFNLEKFKKIAPEKFSDLRFDLHPSCFFLESKFPIFSILKGKKVAKKPELVLVERASGKIEVHLLSEEEMMFLKSISQGKKLFEIYKKLKKNCDIGKILNHFISRRIICGFKL